MKYAYFLCGMWLIYQSIFATYSGVPIGTRYAVGGVGIMLLFFSYLNWRRDGSK